MAEAKSTISTEGKTEEEKIAQREKVLLEE
jgi:hypothetical protein